MKSEVGQVGSYSSAGDYLMTKMLSAVKGKGFAVPGGNKPLTDGTEIFNTAFAAKAALMDSTRRSHRNPSEVMKSLNPDFMNQFGMFALGAGLGGGMNQSALNDIQTALAELGKNVTLTSPLSSGIVPYDLVAPSRLIYPVYSPVRNKLPRVPGQGTSRRGKVITGVTGSRTGSGSTGNAARITIPELNTSLTNWPMNLPASGAQSGTDINIPYAFMGKSEALSWLAQFAGAGFEDISALANLILLQEMMMGEEDEIFSGTTSALPVPAAPTITLRAAGANETAITTTTGNIYVVVTALNYYGETVASAAGSAALGATSVIDVTISPVRGAFNYNIYVSHGTADPGTHYLVAGGPYGAHKVTIQGILPTSGTVPPTADTGTNSANDFEGIMSCLDGHAVTDAAIYPAGFEGGYVNKSIGDILKGSVVGTACQQLWDGAGNGLGAYRADPAELICEGFDAKNFSDDLITGSTSNYRLLIEQSQVAGIRAGGAISEFTNPVTRSIIRIVVHPTLPQGNAFLMSYTLPQAWSNVANVLEMVMAQDYLSISWPVIDASFRYSIFAYGALVFWAAMYCGSLSGLQRSATAPFS